MKPRCAVVIAVCVATTTACGGSSDPAPSHAGKGFDTVISTALEKAQADPMVSDSQMDALHAAEAAGEVAYDAMTAALQDTLACLEQSGFSGGRIVVDESMGFPLPGINDLVAPETVTDEQAGAMMDDCQRTTSAYLGTAYTQQPASQDAYWALADAAAPDVRRCLEESGVPASAIGDTTSEVIDTAVAYFMELDPELEQYGSENCMGDLPVPKANR